MSMNEYKTIGETVICETLPNGLRILINPRPDSRTAFAAFATRYGGSYLRFKCDGEWHDTPAGIAHYLEHKMFDMPEGDNALTDLSSNGADPNAFTAAGMTCYHFDCTENFEENLEMLLHFVSTPYFTEETVSKEQGIIGQEIEMTEDNPSYRLYIDMLKLLYDHHPIRDTVAGSVESISHITPELLYNCYKVFYNPSNMILSVSGNVDPDQVIEIARKTVTAEAGEVPVADFGAPDLDQPPMKLARRVMEVATPLFMIGSKIAPAENGQAVLHQKLTAQLALRILFGNSSEFYTSLYADGLLDHDFDSEIDYSAGTCTVIIGGESDDPVRVLEEVSNTVKQVLAKGIDPADLERAKKASYSARLRGLEDEDNIAIALIESAYMGYDQLDSFEELFNITKTDCEDFIREALDPKKLVLSVIYPKQVGDVN